MSIQMSFGKTLVIITGASRGIGKEIVFQMAKHVESGSVFILTARNMQLLSEVREEVHQINKNHIVEVFTMDLEAYNQPEEERKLPDATRNYINGHFDTLLLFHNAGTTGDVKKPASQLNDPTNWEKYLTVNFTSMVQINNQVLEDFKKTDIKRRIIVNITSLVAIKGFPSLGEYSVGKAAREAFFRVLAAENPGLRVLNYSPGPVDTDMHDGVARDSFDEGIRTAFSRNSETSEVNRSTLTPTQTVAKMMKYIEEDAYESGSRVDYFDLE